MNIQEWIRINGQWRMNKDKWSMKNEGWRMNKDSWSLKNEQGSMVNEELTRIDDHWRMNDE